MWEELDKIAANWGIQGENPRKRIYRLISGVLFLAAVILGMYVFLAYAVSRG